MKEIDKENLIDVESNYIVIDFGYKQCYVFPYKQGLDFIKNLERVEALDNAYDSNGYIEPVRDNFTIKLMSKEEYLNRKQARLLGVSYKEFKSAKSNESEI